MVSSTVWFASYTFILYMVHFTGVYQICADFSQKFIQLSGLPSLDYASQNSMILQKYHGQWKSQSDTFYSLYVCAWMHVHVSTAQNKHTDQNLLMVQWTLTTVCVYVCVSARMSTIRLMLINTFCCVEWNCSEPWHSTAYFRDLNMHVWVCVLAWPSGTTELSVLSEALSATISD